MAEGSKVAEAFVEVLADAAPMQAALLGLPSMMTAPLTKTANFVKSFFTDVFDVGVAKLIGGNIGAAVEHFGVHTAEILGREIKSVLTFFLGETLGGTIGELLERTLNKVADITFGTVGKIIEAVISPIKSAFKQPLFDLDLWVDKAIAEEAEMTRFNSVLKNTGATVGWTAEQLEKMRLSMSAEHGGSPFDESTIRNGMQTLLEFDKVRGDVFQKAMKASVDLAATHGQQPAEVARMLGMALTAPEQGMHMLRRMHIAIDETEKKMVSLAMNESIEAAQAKLLEIIARKTEGTAEAMTKTTEGIINRIRALWTDLGRKEGEIFEPLTKMLAEGALNGVELLREIALPIFHDLKKGVENFVEGAREWFKENEDTFREWAMTVRVIVANLWETIKSGFRNMFHESAEHSDSFWPKIQQGITSTLEFLGALASNWSIVSAGATYAWEIIKDGFSQTVAYLSSNWDTLLDSFLSNILKWGLVLAKALGSAFEVALSYAVKVAIAALKAEAPGLNDVSLDILEALGIVDEAGTYATYYRTQSEGKRIDAKLKLSNERIAMNKALEDAFSRATNSLDEDVEEEQAATGANQGLVNAANEWKKQLAIGKAATKKALDDMMNKAGPGPLGPPNAPLNTPEAGKSSILTGTQLWDTLAKAAAGKQDDLPKIQDNTAKTAENTGKLLLAMAGGVMTGQIAVFGE